MKSTAKDKQKVISPKDIYGTIKIPMDKFLKYNKWARGLSLKDLDKVLRRARG